MVPDGGDLYQVDPGAAKLDRGILLHYLDGFIDAGAAGRLLTAHLLGSLDHEAVVTFDVDRLIDYRSRRPPMTYDKDHWDSYDAPELAIHRVRDGAGKPFLMLTGPEPDHELRTQPGTHRAYGADEPFPFMVRLGAGQHQERRARAVTHLVNGDHGRLVGLPVVPVEGHRRAAGPVVDQAVNVERHHGLVIQAPQQMRGEQPPRRARVDEAVQVMQQDRTVQLRRARVSLVKVPRIRHHAHAPPTTSASS